MKVLIGLSIVKQIIKDTNMMFISFIILHSQSLLSCAQGSLLDYRKKYF